MTGAVIGTGYMGATHAAVLQKLTDKLLICSGESHGFEPVEICR